MDTFGGLLKFVLGTLLALFVGAFVLVSVLGTSDNGDTPQSARASVTESDFGDEWPFTVAVGELTCDNDAVTFTSNGQSYALNGLAKSAYGHPYGSEAGIVKQDPTIDGVWMSTYPVLERGLALCE